MPSPRTGPSGGKIALRNLMDRLEALLRQEDDPADTMKELEERLREAGLVRDLPTDGPMAFVVNLEAVLEELDPGSYRYPLQELEEIETAEELVLQMIRSSWD